MVEVRLHEQAIRAAVGVPGEGELLLAGVAGPDATADGVLYWLDELAVEDAVRRLSGVRDCIVIAPERSGLSHSLPDARVLEVGNPRLAVTRVLQLIRAEGIQTPLLETTTVGPTADVAPSAVIQEHVAIADDVSVAPLCTIGPDVVIGRGTAIHSGARLLARVVIGEDCVIGPNAVVGCLGHGFVHDEAGAKVRIPSLGGVVIGAGVEIGACSVIEAGTIAPTVLNDHAKVGSLVLIGHNAHVGHEANLVGANALGGSSAIGENAWVGFNATVRDGRRVGARALVGMDASVQEDVHDDGVARAPRAEIRMRSEEYDPAIMGFGPSGSADVATPPSGRP